MNAQRAHDKRTFPNSMIIAIALCVQNAAAADVCCRTGTAIAWYTHTLNTYGQCRTKTIQILYWRSLKHIVLLSIEDDGSMFCWIFFSIVLRHWMRCRNRQCDSVSSIRSGRFVTFRNACRFESTRKELIFKLQGVTIEPHSQSSLINSFRFMGFRLWCNSFIIQLFFFVFFFSIVLACLSRVSRVQFHELQRHSHTWIFIWALDT